MKLEPEILHAFSQYKCADGGDFVTISKLKEIYIVEYTCFDFTDTSYYDSYHDALQEVYTRTKYWHSIWENKEKIEL